MDSMKGRSCRNNLLFYGIPERDNETWEDCENDVREIIKEKLQIEGADDNDKIGIERAHRLATSPAKGPRPIIVKFLSYKVRSNILMTGRKIFKKTELSVKEDFPPLIRATRKKLRPYLTDAIDDDKKAYLSYDKLVIDGERFKYDDVINDIRKL